MLENCGREPNSWPRSLASIEMVEVLEKSDVLTWEENANNKQIRNVIWKKKCIVPALILLFLFADQKFP